VRLLDQGLTDPIGEETDAGQAGYRHRQRQAEHRQLPGAPVAPQHAQHQGEIGHESAFKKTALRSIAAGS